MNELFELSLTDLLLLAILIALLAIIMVFLPIWVAEHFPDLPIFHRSPAENPPDSETPAEPVGRMDRPRGLVPLAYARGDRAVTDAVEALPNEPESPTLYVRFTQNGLDTTVFGVVVRMLYDRIFGPRGSDPMLEGDLDLLPFFRDDQGRLIDRDHIERHMTAFLVFVFGGPKNYTGRAMGIAHRPGRPGHAPQKPIDDDAFDRVIAHVADVLTELQVPQPWIAEVAATAETLRGDIVQAVPAREE